ncbi:hypothetical protein ABG067_003532 [Albugo candida]
MLDRNTKLSLSAASFFFACASQSVSGNIQMNGLTQQSFLRSRQLDAIGEDGGIQIGFTPDSSLMVYIPSRFIINALNQQQTTTEGTTEGNTQETTVATNGAGPNQESLYENQNTQGGGQGGGENGEGGGQGGSQGNNNYLPEKTENTEGGAPVSLLTTQDTTTTGKQTTANGGTPSGSVNGFDNTGLLKEGKVNSQLSTLPPDSDKTTAPVTEGPPENNTGGSTSPTGSPSTSPTGSPSTSPTAGPNSSSGDENQ